MRYLKGTQNYGLLYKNFNSNTCVGFSDSDWVGDIDYRKSTSGYIFQVGGTAISWRSWKQSCVALSTAEAEYITFCTMQLRKPYGLGNLLQTCKVNHKNQQ